MISIKNKNLEMSGSLLDLMSESSLIVKHVSKLIRKKDPQDIPEVVRNETLNTYVYTIIDLAYGDSPGELLAKKLKEGTEK